VTTVVTAATWAVSDGELAAIAFSPARASGVPCEVEAAMLAGIDDRLVT
jgi:hypothetical protein